MVSVGTHRLLGGHVLRGAKRLGLLGEAGGRLEHPREAEVGEYRLVVRLPQKDVGRLEIPVNDAKTVGIVQSLCERPQVLQRFIDAHLSPAETVLEVTAGDKLVDDEGEALVFAEVVYLEDVRVIHAGDGLRLLREPTQEGRVFGVVGGKHLDRNVPVQVRIVTPEYGRHTTATELLDHTVPPETTAWRDRDH